jgi:hypothetical protein
VMSVSTPILQTQTIPNQAKRRLDAMWHDTGKPTPIASKTQDSWCSKPLVPYGTTLTTRCQ